MSPSPSYYDSIGLLAICDAIDSVQGIPFHAMEGPKPVGNLKIPGTVYEKIGKKLPTKDTPIQHHLLSHIPVTGMLSPIGSIPYSEQQRVVYSQLANTGQLPTQTVHHTVGGVRPNIPVAHNLNGTSSQRNSITPSNSVSPSIVKKTIPSHVPNQAAAVHSIPSSTDNSASIHRAQANHGLGASNGEQLRPLDGHASMIKSDTLSEMPTSSSQGSKGTSANTTAVSFSTNQPLGKSGTPLEKSNDAYSLENEPLRRVTTDHKLGLVGSDGDSSMYNSTTQIYDDSRPSTPGTPPESMLQAYHVEVCQICGRDFKGRKAATHKQQHIRRLHPAEYTPKRGGKKSRID